MPCSLSGGGIIAWLVAAAYPEVVTRLVVMAAPHIGLAQVWGRVGWGVDATSYAGRGFRHVSLGDPLSCASHE